MTACYHELEEYIDFLREKGLLIHADALEPQEVKYISFDSRDVVQGTLFICKGVHFREEYLAAAKEKGAFCYVAEKRYENLKGIIVSDIQKAMAYMVSLYYGDVWKHLILTGITGTKGKTTTTYMVRGILDDYLKEINEKESAFLSSAEEYDGSDLAEAIGVTESISLYKHFYNAYNNGIKYFTMEIASQALKCHRVFSVWYDVGVFLNIGEDHISDIEHANYEDYFSTKLKLFEQCRMAVVNMNSDFFERVLKAAQKTERVVTFGIDRPEADFYGYDVKSEKEGVSFKVKCAGFHESFEIGMKGDFNADNALAAITICSIYGIPVKNMKAGLKKVKVPGRMEMFSDSERNIVVIVDYAHNQMSMEALFNFVKKEYPGRKISVVFGCAGDVAYGRRKAQGSLAGKYADHVYITEDNPHGESLEKICGEIAEAVKGKKAQWEIILNREAAVKKAIEAAGENAVVLVTGKGRETGQMRGLEWIKTPSDVDCVEAALNHTRKDAYAFVY